MDSPFIFNKYVTGLNFIPRVNELTTLEELIKKREHSLVYEPPKSGKRSIMQQLFIKLRQDSYSFKVCTIDLFNVRTEEDLLFSIRTALVNGFANTQVEKEMLEEDLMLDHIREMTEYRDLVLNLSEALAAKFDTNVIVYFQEFQELLNFENPEETLALLERVWRTHTQTTYLITGSCVNAMKEIFVNHKNFYRFAARVKLEPIEERLFSEYIIKNFLKAGRVVSKELVTQLYNFTEGQPFYTQQLAEIAFNHTRGFLTESLLHESFDDLIELHSYLFRQTTSRLSYYQMNFLKAVLDGVTKFSANNVLTQYQFNSSANVVRLKDAVQKKEILEQEGDKWIFLDPIFKVWLKRVYWNK
ncbi:MAG: hypothetical protein WC833_08195 [Bacteroidales bacterium]|jgi:hypothetical protein